MRVTERDLAHMWAMADGNLASHVLFDHLDMTIEQEVYAEKLPASGLALVRDELSSRREIKKVLGEKYKAHCLADGDWQDRRQIAYELHLNSGGILNCEDFLSMAAQRGIK